MTSALTMLTADLVDDAGLFPPEELSIDAALGRYRADQEDRHPVLTGRFICPSGRLRELRDHLGAADQIALSVVVTPTRPAVAALERQVGDDPRLRLQAVEAVMSRPTRDATVAALVELPESVVRFVEIGVGPNAPRRLDLLAQHGWAAKVRCGGVRADLFPAAAALAAFLVATTERGVPFKATAGLHHAVSYRDPVTTFEHYGFLNLLLAVHLARHSASPSEVAEVLLNRDAAALAGWARDLGVEEAQGVRASLRSYGSCSTSEPITDLERLGLVERLVSADAVSAKGTSHD